MNVQGIEVEVVTAYVADGDVGISLPIPLDCRVIAMARGVLPAMLPFSNIELIIDEDDASGLPRGIDYPIVLLVVKEASAVDWTTLEQAQADAIFSKVVMDWVKGTTSGSA